MDIENIKEKVIKSIGENYTVDLEFLQGYDEQGNIDDSRSLYLGNIINKETKEKVEIQINKDTSTMLCVMLKKKNKIRFCGLDSIGGNLWKM